MRTAVLSDLHLGASGGDDLVRHPEALDRLLAALDGAERVVFLGDMLELRERPLAPLLGEVRPVFEGLRETLADKRVTLVPGNHDHALAEPWLARRRLAGGKLRSEHKWQVAPGTTDDPAGVIAS